MTVSETMVLAGAKALHEEWRASILPGGSNHSMRPIIKDETLFSWENLHQENRDSYLRTARTVLTAALSDQVDGWQDISTAPRKKQILLACADGVVREGHWGAAEYNRSKKSWVFGWVSHPSSGDHKPTHWQPLPAPPPSSTAGEG